MIILRKTIKSSRWWFILRRIIIHKVTMTIIFRMKWTLHTWTHLSRTLLLLSGSNLGWLGAFGYNSPPDDYFDLFCTVISRFRGKSVMLADADVGPRVLFINYFLTNKGNSVHYKWQWVIQRHFHLSWQLLSLLTTIQFVIICDIIKWTNLSRPYSLEFLWPETRWPPPVAP